MLRKLPDVLGKAKKTNQVTNALKHADVSLKDFAANFGKAMFNCNCFKAKSDMDMINDDIDDVRVATPSDFIVDDSLHGSPNSARSISDVRNRQSITLDQYEKRMYHKPPGRLTPTLIETRKCKSCQAQTEIAIVGPSNRNGNVGRPYHRCENCGFQSWADKQGVYPANPLCWCYKPSRLERSGKKKGMKPYYSCAIGECEFHKELRASKNQTNILPIAEMESMSLEPKD